MTELLGTLELMSDGRVWIVPGIPHYEVDELTRLALAAEAARDAIAIEQPGQDAMASEETSEQGGVTLDATAPAPASHAEVAQEAEPVSPEAQPAEARAATDQVADGGSTPPLRSNGGEHICPVCLKGLPTARGLKVHVGIAHRYVPAPVSTVRPPAPIAGPTARFHCFRCDEDFGSGSELAEHRKGAVHRAKAT